MFYSNAILYCGFANTKREKFYYNLSVEKRSPESLEVQGFALRPTWCRLVDKSERRVGYG
jgi:hypothetical protein